MAKKSALSGSGKTLEKLKEKQKQKLRQSGNEAKGQGREPMLQAMVWYKGEDYPPLLEIFEDKELLPPTFTDWQTRAEKKKQEVEAAGNRVIKVFIDPETFPEWCNKKGLKMDANARSQLALEVAQSQSFRL